MKAPRLLPQSGTAKDSAASKMRKASLNPADSPSSYWVHGDWLDASSMLKPHNRRQHLASQNFAVQGGGPLDSQRYPKV